MKQIKIILLVVFVLGLTMANAFALGIVNVTSNSTTEGPLTVAAEALGVARNVFVLGNSSSGAASSAVGGVVYTTGSALMSGDILSGELSGVKFNGDVYICYASSTAASLSSEVGRASVTAGAPNFISATSFTTQGGTLPASSLLYLTSKTCTDATQNAANLAINVPASTQVGNYTITLKHLNSSAIVTKDAPRAANVIRVVNEITTTVGSVAAIAIDYLTVTNSTPADGSLFVGSGVGSNVIAGSDTSLTTTRAGGLGYSAVLASGAGITFSQRLLLTDSANWAGVTRVWTQNTNTVATNICSFASNTASNSSPATIAGGVVNLAIPPMTALNAAAGAGSDYDTICIQVAGNAPIARRTITGTYTYTAGSGGIAPAGDSNKLFQVWTPNGYQAMNSYMYVGADQTTDVFNRFYNNSAVTANVFVEVFPPAGGATTVLNLGTIAPNSSGLYWGSTIGGSAGLAVGSSYAARFTITANPASVNGVSFFKRSTGERQLPLYKMVNSAGTDAYLSE